MREYAGNPDVSFGDVNLSEESIRENFNPGSGGWPTILYFNKETGIEGGRYEKITDGAMCDELGDIDHLSAYIEGYGNTSKCNISTKKGCDEREVSYIDKMMANSVEEAEIQLARLDGMKDSAMKPELKQWLKKRKKILSQIVSLGASDGEEL